MKPMTSEYAIGRYLIHMVEETGLPLHQILKKIDYPDPLTGVLAFNDWLNKGQGDPVLIRRMVKAGILKSVEDLERALFVTNEELFAEQWNKKAREQQKHQ